MKKIGKLFSQSIKTTPFFGRTIVVLSFFCLFIKQIFIFLAYGQVFQEPTRWATLGHYFGYFISDFLICLLVLALMGINMFFKKTWIKIINNILISIIFLLFVFDTFTIYFLQSRVSILDMNQFINPSLWNFSWLIVSIISILGIIGIITFVFVQGGKFKKTKKMILAAYFLVFAIACLGLGLHTSGWFTSLPDNIISLNFSAIQDYFQWISESNLPNNYKDFFGIKKWLRKRPNVIVVFAESLSAIDSLRVGGVNDNLPYFDLIQKQGITFKNFIANGWTSDTAHIALLLGIESIRPVWSQIYSYSGYKPYTDSLPVFFGKQWYISTFISAASLDFLDQRDFLSGAWFTKIVGEEAFSDQERYTFDSAPDHILYNKTLQTIRQQSWSYLLVLQTISFHKPYNTPYGKTQSDAIRYADKSLYYFYIQLKKAHFFDNGVLVVVGDHRKMNPLEEKEKEALWSYRYTRSLATVVGTGITPWTVNKNIIQHTDFFYSLKQLVGQWAVMVSKLYNDVLTLKKNRNRGISYSRYYNNKYTIVEWLNTGKVFNSISEITDDYPLIHKYLASYTAFQYESWLQLSWDKTMAIIWHRGAPLYTTENSLSGFLLAKKQWAAGIEFDVSYTKDKQNIVMHWASVYPTICGDDIQVSTHTLEWLQKNCPLTNGEKIMTLKEMLENIDGIFDYYFVEIKVYDPMNAEQQTKEIIKIVQDLGMQDRVIFTSYDKTATYILWSYSNITAWRDTYNITDLDIIPNMNHQYYLMPQELIKGSMPQEIKDMGKKLVSYTVNTTGELQRLYDLWVRMIMTDNVPLMKHRADKYLGK